MKINYFLYPFLAVIATHSYAQKPVEVTYKSYQVSRSLQKDSTVISLLQPYKDSLSAYLNTVIGFSNSAMYKKQPECALGNVMADCMKLYASKIFGIKVDVAVINYGSVRSFIPKGEITLQTMYDLVPFDNQIVLQKINGNTLHQLLDRMAYEGGWPCAGITLQIKDKEASDIRINNVLLNDTTVYTLAVSDYLAHGGDGCSMLKNITQQSKNYLYRDALTAYIKSFTSAGKPVSANLENRIINGNK